jgi:hypothetical protein
MPHCQMRFTGAMPHCQMLFTGVMPHCQMLFRGVMPPCQMPLLMNCMFPEQLSQFHINMLLHQHFLETVHVTVLLNQITNSR